MQLLSLTEKRLPFSTIREAVLSAGDGFTFDLIRGSKSKWLEVGLYHAANNHVIGHLSWTPVRAGAARNEGWRTVVGILEGLEDQQPACNLEWLNRFLPLVKSAYWFNLFSETEVNDGLEAVDAVCDVITSDGRTAVHVEGEGWWNTHEDIITLEQPGPIPDLWPMALFLDDQWHRFAMRTNDSKAKARFLRGVLPLKANALVVPASELDVTE